MRLRSKFWVTLFTVSLMAGGVRARQAPQPDPTPGAHLVRLRTGSYAGMCIGWCDSETIIEPGSIHRISRAFSEKKKYPEMKTKYAITRKDWDDLQRFIDASVLAAFTGRIGCPGCADEMVEWVEVEFSDGTKKSVSYNEGSAPRPIATLMQKIEAIGTKPKPQGKVQPAAGKSSELIEVVTEFPQKLMIPLGKVRVSDLIGGISGKS